MSLNKESSVPWAVSPLEEIAVIQKGKNPSGFCTDLEQNRPYLEAAVLRKQRAPQLISTAEISDLVCAEESDSLILWDGANAGDVFWGIGGVVASTMARVKVASRKIMPEFLYYFLCSKSPYLRENVAGSTVPHVRPNIVASLSVPLPPLPVQERIVQILQKSDEIRRKRQEAADAADTILPSSFISMFGDPSKNHGDFERLRLDAIAEVQAGVMKGRKLKGKEAIEVPYLRVANVQDGFLDLSEIKTIEAIPRDLEKYRLENGDILMTEGGDPDKLGRGCVWRDQVKGCIYQNHIFRVRTNRDKLTPEYLAALMRTRYAKQYFLSCAKRSSNLASINSSQVKAFQVPLPPLLLQEKFVSAAEQWIQASDRFITMLKDSKRLFAGIMSEAFAGKLTAEWEEINRNWIKDQMRMQERLPCLLLLALIREKITSAQQKAIQKNVLVTALMKYAFLLQLEGSSHPRLYNFIPYYYGPFDKQLYTDLEYLQAEGLVVVNNHTDEDKIRISILDARKVDETLADLPDSLKDDVALIIKTYGNLEHNSLLKTVYDKYPMYATRSRLRSDNQMSKNKAKLSKKS